jgi:hypothetical protein
MLFVVGELGIRFKALCGGFRATKYAAIPAALTSDAACQVLAGRLL